MGPFPHDGPVATISDENPAGTDGFEFVEFAHDEPEKLEELFTKMATPKLRPTNLKTFHCGAKAM